MSETTPVRWQVGARTLDLEQARILGVLNVTPDSFSDGGRFADSAAAVAHGQALARAGADVLDVGGESTRPGAAPVDEAEELRRVIPVVRELAHGCYLVSIDTAKPAVAAAALEAGAVIVNDVTALTHPEMAQVVARHRAGVILMHMQGRPRTMQDAPRYTNVVEEVAGFLAGARDRVVAAGVEAGRIVLDPGIGFGKTTDHNLELLAGLPRLTALGHPVLVGVSRKRFIHRLADAPEPRDRLGGSLAAALAARAGGAMLFRVHDVAATRQALTVFDAIADTARTMGLQSGGAEVDHEDRGGERSHSDHESAKIE